MTVIRKLSPALVNKIAAGEVIERPASVVKELVENALDATSTRIDVAIEDGGSRLIRVRDNGCGMSREDLPLAVAPHATSKIHTTDDLFNIHSLGFRGEALASIASVSHLRITTRPADQLEACELTLCHNHEADSSGIDSTNPSSPQQGQTAGSFPDDETVRIAPCAAPPGTVVEVRNLFYNLPARRKFLRRPQTECSHVTEQIARLALAHPRIAFTLTHNGRTLRNLPAGQDRRQRIADFYGHELADCLLDVHREERGLAIDALIAPPAESRASSKWQYIFLNGRHISDRRIGFAIREAYRGLAEHDRYAVVFLFLDADPQEFDINVHPTKSQARWRDAGLVQSQVLAVLRETLLSSNLTPGLRTQEKMQTASRTTDLEAQHRARQALADYLKRVDPTQTRLTFSSPPFPTQRLRPSIAGIFKEPRVDPPASAAGPPRSTDTTAHSAGPPASPREEGVDAGPELQDRSLAEGPPSIAEFAGSSPSPDSEFECGDPADLQSDNTVLQVHNTYLVAQTTEGVIIIDQHALHERILYERFRERILQGPLQSQGMLIPETLEADSARLEAAEKNAGLLQQLGIELSVFGPGVLAVQRFPTLLHKVEIKTFVGDLLDRLAEGGEQSEETLIHAALDMMACKAAVKAGDALTTEEIHALLAQRHLTQRSSNCPHGRPTTLELTTRDLEKQFRRT